MRIFCDGMKHPTRCWWRVLLSNLCIWSFDQTEGILNPSNFGNQLYEEPGSKYNKELLRIPWVIPCTRRKELGKSTNFGNHCLFVLAYCCLKSVGFPMLLIDLCKTHTMEWYSKLGGCSKLGSRVILAQLLAFQEQAQHETMKPKWKRSTLTTSCWTRHSEIVQYLQSWLFSFRWTWSPGWVRSCFPFSLIPMCWQVKMKKQADAQLSNDKINQSPSRQSPSPEKKSINIFELSDVAILAMAIWCSMWRRRPALLPLAFLRLAVLVLSLCSVETLVLPCSYGNAPRNGARGTAIRCKAFNLGNLFGEEEEKLDTWKRLK